jgi:hypothetical protein
MKINSYNLLAPISLQIIPRNGDLEIMACAFFESSIYMATWLAVDSLFQNSVSTRSFTILFYLKKKTLKELFLLTLQTFCCAQITILYLKDKIC